MPADAVAPDLPSPWSPDVSDAESLLDARSDCGGLVAIGAGQDADELVGTEAGGTVLAPQDRAEHVGEGLEHVVAGVVAPPVVELSEAVDVGHDQRRACPRVARLAQAPCR